jgi:glycosyltransferase involved in cell wall biosynthesis
MPSITAILHTKNDELRIARAVESLRPCDEVLVVDHGSSDETCAVARRFGARVITAPTEAFETRPFLADALSDWIFCMQPTESLSERLEASLLEWKLAAHSETAFEVFIFDETLLKQETRLVTRTHEDWDGWRPLAESRSSLLDGHLLRMSLP